MTTTATVERAAGGDDLTPLWAQLGVETDAEFAAFQEFLLLGGARTLSAAFKLYCDRQGRNPVSGIQPAYRDMASRNRWVERASAWDAHAFAVMRARHISKLNQAIDILFEGAVDAAKCLVAAVKAEPNKKVDRTRLLAASMILDRCGIMARGTSYAAPTAINATNGTSNVAEVIVRFENAPRTELERLAGYDDAD